MIDLGEVMREQFYLALPMKPLCREDCQGLCPVCGINRNRETCTCQAEWVDPRLEAVRGSCTIESVERSMPNPKRRHSKTPHVQAPHARHAQAAIAMGECPQCHELKPPHVVCTNCGYYRGRAGHARQPSTRSETSQTRPTLPCPESPSPLTPWAATTRPAVVVAGAVLAARELGLPVALVGPADRVRAELARHAGRRPVCPSPSSTRPTSSPWTKRRSRRFAASRARRFEGRGRAGGARRRAGRLQRGPHRRDVSRGARRVRPAAARRSSRARRRRFPREPGRRCCSTPAPISSAGPSISCSSA